MSSYIMKRTSYIRWDDNDVTDHHEQVQDYFKCCITSVSYALITFNKLVMVLMTYIPWLKRCLDSLISWLACWLRYPHLLCGIWIQRTNIQIGFSWISVVVSCCPRMISSPMWKIQTKVYRMVIFALVHGGQCLVKVKQPLPYSRSCSWQSEFGSSKIISGIILNLFMVAGN
jgi:hypothetical protein